MRGPIDLDDLTKHKRRRYSPDEAAERNRLAAHAQSLATKALRALHKKDYDDLYEQAKRKVGLVD